MEILQAISDDLGLDIESYYADIGIMQKIKAKIKDDTVHQWTDYFIRYDLATIADLRGERFIHDKRLNELRRERQGSSGKRNGGEVCQRAGVFNQPEIWPPDA
jgi:hypothetical protein